jgi:hypothetical protein
MIGLPLAAVLGFYANMKDEGLWLGVATGVATQVRIGIG